MIKQYVISGYTDRKIWVREGKLADWTRIYNFVDSAKKATRMRLWEAVRIIKKLRKDGKDFNWNMEEVK